MLKSVAPLLTFLLLFSFVPSGAQEKFEWKEMDDFHTVMSGTFHPSQGGDLGPIRSRSGEMAEKAVTWQKSKVPDGLNKKEIRASLKKLVASSKELDKLVKSNADDETLKQKLSSLHDVFHGIKDAYDKKEKM